MSLELVELREQMGRIEASQRIILRLLNETRRPDLTVRQFAKEAGRSRTYIYDLLNSNRLTKRKGRIPASELAKFTS